MRIRPLLVAALAAPPLRVSCTPSDDRGAATGPPASSPPASYRGAGTTPGDARTE
jgi:hypothetical protein